MTTHENPVETTGPPSGSTRPARADLDRLVAAALDQPGEWVRVKMPSPNRGRSSVARRIGRMFSDMATRGDYLYLRINATPPDDQNQGGPR
jgi:hypothetical protein